MKINNEIRDRIMIKNFILSLILFISEISGFIYLDELELHKYWYGFAIWFTGFLIIGFTFVVMLTFIGAILYKFFEEKND